MENMLEAQSLPASAIATSRDCCKRLTHATRNSSAQAHFVCSGWIVARQEGDGTGDELGFGGAVDARRTARRTHRIPGAMEGYPKDIPRIGRMSLPMKDDGMLSDDAFDGWWFAASPLNAYHHTSHAATSNIQS